MRAISCFIVIGSIFLALLVCLTAAEVHAQTAVTAYYPPQPAVGYVPVRRGLFGLRTGYIPVMGYTAPQAVTAYYAPTTAVTSYRVEAPFCGAAAATTAYYAPAVSAATTTYYAPSMSPATTTYYAPSVPPATDAYYAPSAATTTYYAPPATVTTYSVPVPVTMESTGVTTYYVAPPEMMP